MDERNFRENPGFADKLRGLDWKKIAIILVALLLVVVLLVVVINVFFKSKKTDPIKYMQKYDNAKTVDLIKLYSEAFNGVDKGNIAKILKIIAKSDDFKEYLEDFEENWAEDYEDKKDEYGSNFKITYKNDKDVEEKLDRDDLKSYKSTIRSMGESIVDSVKEFKAMDKADQKDLAEEMGISYDDLKDLVKYLEAYGKELKGASVEDGYELEVIKTITGKELDEPEEDDIDMIVLKVNGKWISYDILRSMNILNLLR